MGDDFVCVADSIYVALDSSHMWSDMSASISIDEYNTGNENCANSITGKRRQLLHPFLRFTRWGILSFLVSALGCFGETAFGDDCAHSSTSMGRAIGVGSTVSGGVEGLFWLRQRFLMRNFVEPPPFDVPLEP